MSRKSCDLYLFCRLFSCQIKKKQQQFKEDEDIKQILKFPSFPCVGYSQITEAPEHITPPDKQADTNDASHVKCLTLC